jgi:hypothetical protein
MEKPLGSQNITRKKRTGRKFFQPPWKYREGFVLALGLLSAGFLIEIVTTQPGISIPSFPFNMYAGMAFMTTIAFLHFFYRDDHFVRWLSTMPAATSSILLITLLTILMGVFDQSDPGAEGTIAALGLTHVKNSWVFLLAQLFVLTSLGLVTLRRSIPLKKKNIGFILNHAGLWLVIAAASLGTGDLRRLRMELHQGEPVWYAFDNQSHVHQLPFALELINFDIEEYPPQLAIVDSHTGLLSDPVQRPLPHIEAGKSTRLLDWEIEIDEFLPMALYRDDRFVLSDETGAPPVAKVRATNGASGESHEGWITCGSFMFDAEYIWLDGRNVLIMTVPEPRRYQSHVIARTIDHEPRELFIEVNKPPRVAGWRLYQMSYNQAMGKWSQLSVLEIVRDPWLPLVYAGFFMLFAGAVYIFWIGKELKEE